MKKLKNGGILPPGYTAKTILHCGPSAPILEGAAAEEFLKTIEQNKNKKVPKEEYDRAKENYKKFKVI